MGNCSFGSCQGKEIGQAQGHERCSQLEVRRKLDSNTMPEGGVVIHCVLLHNASHLFYSLFFVCCLNEALIPSCLFSLFIKFVHKLKSFMSKWPTDEEVAHRRVE